jgi:hypothetical protein
MEADVVGRAGRQGPPRPGADRDSPRRRPGVGAPGRAPGAVDGSEARGAKRAQGRTAGRGCPLVLGPGTLRSDFLAGARAVERVHDRVWCGNRAVHAGAVATHLATHAVCGRGDRAGARAGSAAGGPAGEQGRPQLARRTGPLMLPAPVSWARYWCRRRAQPWPRRIPPAGSDSIRVSHWLHTDQAAAGRRARRRHVLRAAAPAASDGISSGAARSL